MEEYKTIAPRKNAKIDQISHWVKDIDKEVLVDSKKVPSSAIFTPRSLENTNRLIKGMKIVQVFAIGFTAYDLELASEESIKQKSIKPLSVEVLKQSGGWGGFVAGARIGTAVGVAVGIETGPGAIITGAIGGIIFSIAGYNGASFITKQWTSNSGGGGDFGGGGASGSW